MTASAEFRVTDGPDNNFPTGELVARKEVAPVAGSNDDVTPAIVQVLEVIGTSGMVATSVQAVKFTGAPGVQGNIDLARSREIGWCGAGCGGEHQSCAE